MPAINRSFILTTSPKTLLAFPQSPHNRHHLSTSAPLALDSQFHRSDFSTQGYSGVYEPGRPTEGPLSQASRHGAPRITPKRLKEHLDKFVVGQDKAKKVTSVAIYNHYQRIREIRRQEAEEQGRKSQWERWELSERERDSHPVENEFPGHVQSVDLNRAPEPEPELGSKPLEDNPATIIEKSNLMLLGPSGVGKTYILQTLARVLEVPFATVDCSALTQAGYIGTDIESSIERLLLASSHEPKKCETGIIFFDEVDKLAKPAIMTHGRDVSGEGVQQGLLKMIEGTTVTVNAKSDRNSKTDQHNSRGSDRLERGGREGGIGNQGPKSEQYTIDTSNILFVFAGAFVGLEKIINKRLSSGSSIGFGAPIRSPPPPLPSSSTSKPKGKSLDAPPPSNPLAKVTPTDLQTYGLIPELLGRIPITVSLSPLSLTQLVSILTEPKNSLIKQYIALFNTYGIQLRFTTAALHAIAERALGISSGKSKNASPSPSNPEEKSGGIGARGLRAIMEDILQEAMFVGPGSGFRFCLVDELFVRSSESKDGESHHEEERVRLPRTWSRGQSTLFEQAYEKEELEWDARVNGDVMESREEENNAGSFERLREVGSSGM
ncbi:P-loop containing nucleoside triphosphate hydrolase protein [Tricladium varicosporioides]|nr:P-loop containing nucleoside triphosphate hydrolase protein [Hymenoscyphus varicosporioides]